MNESSCEIYKCTNNIAEPKKRFSIFKTNESFNKLKHIYTNNSFKSIQKSINEAYKVKSTHQDIEELYYSATNLINKFESLDKKDIDLDLFNILANEFKYEHEKYLNPTYSVVSNKVKNMLQLVQCYKKKSVGQNIKNKILECVHELYNESKLTLLLVVTSKINYFNDCDIFSDIWNILQKVFMENQVESLYCMIVNMKILFLENLQDPETKLKIYYDIDIESLRSDMKCDNYNDRVVNYINLFIDISNEKINKLTKYDSSLIFSTIKKLFKSSTN